jgi:hypothetical protein
MVGDDVHDDKPVLVLHLSTLKLKFPQCLHIPYFKNIDLYTYINGVQLRG